MTFGSVVNAKRKELGLTLERVGKKIGASKGYLSGLERDAVAPPAAPVVRRLARALNLELPNLMRLAWLPKVPKEIRPLLEEPDASQNQLQPASEISTEAAAKVFKEVMLPDGTANPPAGCQPVPDPNVGRYGPVSLPVDQVPVRPVGGERA